MLQPSVKEEKRQTRQAPLQSLTMQTMTNLQLPEHGWLAKKVGQFLIDYYTAKTTLYQVIGDNSKPFYDRRPQSRIRINSKAHRGFCGTCQPCSCRGSRRPTVVESKVDCWWGKPKNYLKNRNTDVNVKRDGSMASLCS